MYSLLYFLNPETGFSLMLAMVSSPTTTGQSRAWSGWGITVVSKAVMLTSMLEWMCSLGGRWWEECLKQIRYLFWSRYVCFNNTKHYCLSEHTCALLCRHWKSFGSTTSLLPFLLRAGCMRSMTRLNSARIRTSEVNTDVNSMESTGNKSVTLESKTKANVLSFLQVLGSSLRLSLHPSSSLFSSVHFLFLPGLWEGLVLERTGNVGVSAATGSCLGYLWYTLIQTS